MKRKYILSILLGLLCVFGFGAELSEYYYKNIGIEDGLSQSSVTSVVYDPYGSLWIGTRYGLNEYRNHEIRSVYKLGCIHTLFLDDSERLWVAAQDGIYTYDFESGQVVRRSTFKAFCIYQGKDYLFFGGEGGMLLYNGESFTLIKKSGAYLTGIYNYDDGLLVVDKGTGLYRFRNLSFEKLEYSALNGSVILASELYGDTLFLSIYRQGLLNLNLKTGEYRFYNTSNSKLSFNILLSLLIVDDELWIGSDGGGLDVLSLKDGNIKAKYIPSNSISCLYEDPFKNIWVGTICSGLYGLRPSKILSYTSDNSALSYDVIDEFAVSYDGNLWLATDGGGVNKFIVKNSTVIPFLRTRGLKVSSMVELSRDKLLLSLYSVGLNVYDLNTGKLTPFIIKDAQANYREFFYGNPPNLYAMGGGHFLIMGIDVYDYDFNRDTFTKFLSVSGGSMADMRVCGSYEDVLYAYNSESIFVIQPSNYKVSRIPLSQNDFTINTAAFGENLVWIGAQDGLYWHDMNTGITRKYESNLFERVTHLHFDRAGDLWIAADNTLFKKSEGRVEIIGENEGVGANEIRYGIEINSGDEPYLFLGGTKGMLRIRTDDSQVFGEEYEHPLNLNNVSIDGRNVVPDRGTISLTSKYSQFRLSIGLSLMDPFEKTAYRYEIKGKSDYTIESYDDYILLPALKEGTYDISVSYFKNSGIWSEPSRILTLKVLPPWYRTPLFVGLILLIFIAMMSYGVVWLYNRRVATMERDLRARNSDFAEKLDAYIMENMSSQNLDIPSIAMHMAMSRASLYSKSKKVLGKGIGEYVDEMRMKEACRLLAEENLSMSEIAYRVGYNSSRYFSTRFKKVTGFTPRDYRTKHRKAI